MVQTAQRCPKNMLLRSVLYGLSYLLAFGGTLNGVIAQVQTQPKIYARTGEDAKLSCQLLINKDTEQVTWQLEHSNRVQSNRVLNNIATSKPRRVYVDPEFVNKVKFVESGLKKNAIVITNVTEDDERCYFCKFSVFPVGVLSAKTCLRVYELHEPVIRIRAFPEESVVWCSATGVPAPTVTLTVPQQHLHLSQYNTTRVTNSNNTVTVTNTAVLSGLYTDNTPVGCAARVDDAGPQMEVLKRISELKHASDGGLKDNDASDGGLEYIYFSWPIIAAVFGLVSYCVCVWCGKRVTNGGCLYLPLNPNRPTVSSTARPTNDYDPTDQTRVECVSITVPDAVLINSNNFSPTTTTARYTVVPDAGFEAASVDPRRITDYPGFDETSSFRRDQSVTTDYSNNEARVVPTAQSQPSSVHRGRNVHGEDAGYSSDDEQFGTTTVGGADLTARSSNDSSNCLFVRQETSIFATAA